MNVRNAPTGADVDWQAGIVAIIGRLQSGGSGPVGTGFIASQQGHIVTCHHVLQQADWPYSHWDTPLQVRFNANRRFAGALVLEANMKPEADMAILSLADGLPPEASVLPLGAAQGSEGHATLMWGFPAGYASGLLGQGEVLGFEGRGQLQLTSTQTTHGYSGGPVWDTAWQRVIGMISSGSTVDNVGRLQYENFALPADRLVELSGGLLELTPLGDVLPVDMSNYDNRPLYREMRERFNMDDLADLAFELEIDLQDLAGTTKSAKIRELITYLERRDKIPQLLQALSAVEDLPVDWYAVSKVRLL
jgi:hypothetical protein